MDQLREAYDADDIGTGTNATETATPEQPSSGRRSSDPASATRDLEHAVARLAELLKSKDFSDDYVEHETGNITDDIIRQISMQISNVVVDSRATPTTPQDYSASMHSITPSPAARPAPHRTTATPTSRAALHQTVSPAPLSQRVPVLPASYHTMRQDAPVQERRSKSAPRGAYQNTSRTPSQSQGAITPRASRPITPRTDIRARTPPARRMQSPGRIEERLLQEGEMMRLRKAALAAEYQHRQVAAPRRVVSEDKWKSIIARMEDSHRVKSERLSRKAQEYTARELQELTTRPSVNPRSLKMTEGLETLTHRLNDVIQMRERRIEQFRRRAEEETSKEVTLRPRINEASRRLEPRNVDALQEWNKRRVRRIESAREARERQETGAVTGRPTISSRSAKLVSRQARDTDPGRRLFSHGNELRSRRQEQAERVISSEGLTHHPSINERSRQVYRGSGPVGDRLYTLGMQQKTRRAHQEEQERMRETPNSRGRSSRASSPLSSPRYWGNRSTTPGRDTARSFISDYSGGGGGAYGADDSVTVVGYDPRYDAIFRQVGALLPQP